MLTETLPIRFSSLYAQVQLEAGRPDFVFVEPGATCDLSGHYGVIELKRPRDKILRVYGSHIVPSAKLGEAKSQVHHYLDELRRTRLLQQQGAIALGSTQYAFIVMGMNSEIMRKCGQESYQLQLRNLLPPGMQIILFDELLGRLERQISRLVICETMFGHSLSSGIRLPGKFFYMVDNQRSEGNDAFTVWAKPRLFNIYSGEYRQVYGTPRRLWPVGKKLREYYDFELKDKIGSEKFDYIYNDLATAAEGLFPFEAFEISGFLDAECGNWVKGTKIEGVSRKGEEFSIEMEAWYFTIYEGDKIYDANDNLLYAFSEPKAKPNNDHL